MARYCSSCGRSIPLDAKICPYCGKSIALHEGLIVPEPEQKKDKTVLIIVAVVVLLLVVPIAIAATVYVYVSGMLPGPPISSIKHLSLEKENDSLVVIYVYPSDLQWEEVIVSSGSATLPSGVINEGDTIIDCNGLVALEWTSTNEPIGSWAFY
jgi:predicted nucleic acid-binding Zn ribbon protein